MRKIYIDEKLQPITQNGPPGNNMALAMALAETHSRVSVQQNLVATVQPKPLNSVQQPGMPVQQEGWSVRQQCRSVQQVPAAGQVVEQRLSAPDMPPARGTPVGVRLRFAGKSRHGPETGTGSVSRRNNYRLLSGAHVCATDPAMTTPAEDAKVRCREPVGSISVNWYCSGNSCYVKGNAGTAVQHFRHRQRRYNRPKRGHYEGDEAIWSLRLNNGLFLFIAVGFSHLIGSKTKTESVLIMNKRQSLSIAVGFSHLIGGKTKTKSVLIMNKRQFLSIAVGFSQRISNAHINPGLQPHCLWMWLNPVPKPAIKPSAKADGNAEQTTQTKEYAKHVKEQVKHVKECINKMKEQTKHVKEHKNNAKECLKYIQESMKHVAEQAKQMATLTKQVQLNK